ncbi:Ldh family oxidoreductase [Neomoorella mulderi]|nr:Ldh family oxidoreductase [Moorella mulderi]
MLQVNIGNYIQRCGMWDLTILNGGILFMTSSLETKRFDYLRLKKFCVEIIEKVGVSKEGAEIVGSSLVRANLRGVDSHGIQRLPIYTQRVKEGLINSRAEIRLLRDNYASVLIDGGNGFGQIVAHKAMQECVNRALKYGVGVAGVANSHNFGAGALVAMEALKYDMIGVVVSNAAPTLPPWGGTSLTLGTNPLAVAIPTKMEFPIVLDMATSVVARDKITLYKKMGKKIPLGWALTKDGRPTEDPQEALEGILLSIGGPKGYGLALVIDILAGVMTGAAFGKDVGMLYDMSRPSAVGNFMMAINISSFMEVDVFKERLERLCAQIKASELLPGVNEVFLPGEIEYREEQDRMKNGIPIGGDVLKDLEKLSSEYHVSL